MILTIVVTFPLVCVVIFAVVTFMAVILDNFKGGKGA
jgi:hypothetical protein